MSRKRVASWRTEGAAMNEDLWPEQVSAAEAKADDRISREEFPTPRLLVRSALGEAFRPEGAMWRILMSHGLRWALVPETRSTHPLRVLDVCAGWGAWASEMRRLAQGQGWPVHITGVEIDESKLRRGSPAGVLASEIADLEIVTCQAREILGHDLVDAHLRAKLERLKNLLDESGAA